MEQLYRLEHALSHAFADKRILESALTHRSFVNENPGVDLKASSENLALVGDKVIGKVAILLLFQRFPGEDHGELSRRRDKLVCGTTLANIAHHLGLGDMLRVGKGVELTGGRTNPNLLSNALEACIGAICMDAADNGIKAEAVARRLLTPRLDAPRLGDRSAKNALQELCVKMGKGVPTYEVLDRRGPDHAPVFDIICKTASGQLGRGEGPSKAAAETAAAVAALTALDSGGGGAGADA